MIDKIDIKVGKSTNERIKEMMYRRLITKIPSKDEDCIANVMCWSLWSNYEPGDRRDPDQ